MNTQVSHYLTGNLQNPVTRNSNDYIHVPEFTVINHESS